jgi:hypothetical protein
MGRSKASVDDEDFQSLRQEFVDHRQEMEELRSEVAQLKTSLGLVQIRQDDMFTAVDGVNSAVIAMGSQLTSMTQALNTLLAAATPPVQQFQQQPTVCDDVPEASNRQVKSPTLQQQENTAALRQHLAFEMEKTKVIDLMTQPNLPPLNISRQSAPPGFNYPQKQHPTQSLPITPNNAQAKPPRTPVFHNFQPPAVRKKWEGYHRDYETEMRTIFLKSITKGPRMDFPRFEGENPVGWIRQCEKYFQMAAAPEEYKVHLSQLYFVGRADVWLRRSSLLKQQLSWTQFSEEVTHRFLDHSSYELTEKFNAIKQNTLSVSEYTDLFEELMADVQEENPQISESWFVRCYVNGLKESIKAQLRPLKPATLTDAYWQARDMELCQPTKRPFIPNFQKFSGPAKFSTPHMPVVSKPPENTTVQSRTRKQNECWRCGGPWFQGHKCKTVPALNYIANADDEVQQQCLESQQEQQVDMETAPLANDNIEDTLMHISVQALGGPANEDSPYVQVCIGGKQTIALIDSGSNASFVDLSFATTLNCKLEQSATSNIKVAGGGHLISNSTISDCHFSIAKHQFIENFRVLHLPDNSVILGCDWLKKHSPVAFDFRKKTFTLHKFGRYPVTFPTCSGQKQVIEIHADKMEKLLTKNCSGFIIQLHTLSVCSEDNTKQHPEIASLLQHFTDVFAEPPGLPPHRSYDHSIHLKDGAVPPILRPYRVPHRQKSEVEKQIQELLSKKLVRASQSAYASPIILVNKKDSSQRLCVDFRKLNGQSIKN